MRYISTSNGQVSFVEVNDQNVILTSRSFNFGSMYYTIKNNKITFYSADSETPYRSDLWTVDIPVTIDNEVYSTVEDAIEALGKIFDNGLTKKVDELEQDLNDEVTRSISAETALDGKINVETTRAQAAESANTVAITNEVNRATTAEGVITSNLNAEVTRATTAEGVISANLSAETNRAITAEGVLADNLAAEVSRAQAAETANANAISAESNRAQAAESAITANLNAEVTRAEAAEQAISGAVDTEVTRAQAAEGVLDGKIDAEVTRAQSAESALTNAINSEVSRAEAAEQAISGALDTEVSRAQAAEGVLDGKIDAEISRAQSAETAISDNLAAEVSRAQAAEQALSGAVTNLDSVKADKANAVASAEYVSTAKTINLYDISGNVLSSIDCTDFIKDGMVSNVEVSNGYLVITFNTDAGKEAIRIPLTDIFDPSNYYNKTDIDGLMSGKTDTAVTATLSADVLTISGDVTSHVSNADVHVTVADKTSWADKYTQAQVDAKVSALSGAISDEATARSNADGVISGAVTAHTSNADIHVTVEDKANWDDKYTKSETDEAISEAVSIKADISAVTAIEDSLSGYTTTGDTNALSGTVTAHTANTDIHVTAQDKSTWSGKQNQLIAGENITISGDVISAAGGEADDHFDSTSTNPVENRVVTDAVIAPAKDYWVSNGSSQSVSRDYLDGIVLKYKVIQYPDDVPPEATLPDNFQINIAIADSPYGGSVWPAIQVTSFSAKTATVDNDNVHLEWDEDGLIISVINPYSITRINCYTVGYRILSNSFSYSGGTVVDEAEKIIDEIGNVKQFADKAVKDVYLSGNGSDVVLSVSKFNGDSTQNNFSMFLGNGLTCENNKIVTDLNVPLGYSGWTSVEIPMDSNRVSIQKWHNEVRVTIKDWSAQYYASFQIGIGNADNSMTTYVTLNGYNVDYAIDYFTSVTFENEVLTMVVGEVWGQATYITFVDTFDLNNKVSAVEYYGEATEPIIDYVQDLNSGLTTVSGDVANKQDVLTAGNGIDITSNVISVTGGSSVTIDPTLDSGSTNPVANSAITANINYIKAYAPKIGGESFEPSSNQNLIGFGIKSLDGNVTTSCVEAFVGNGLIKTDTRYLKVNFTNELTSASTTTQVPSAKAVYDALQEGGGGSSINVVQTTGTSTGDVMSQDAVTTALAGKSATGHTHTSGDVTNLSTVLAGYATTSTTNSINGTLTGHTGDSTIHVTSSDKSTWSGKQDALVSGTNIKTINGTSILGSGDITVNLNIWSGTAAQYAQISPKDPNTLYLVY